MITVRVSKCATVWLLCGIWANALALTPHVVYDFESLSNGSLLSPAQDGWQPQIPFGGIGVTDVIVETIGSGDESHVGRGSCIDGATILRLNDSSFSFPSIQTGLTHYASMMDVLVRNTPGDYSMMFALAGDGSDDGVWVDNPAEIGPQFGFRRRDSVNVPLSISLRRAAGGAFVDVPVGTLAADGDWVRLRLEVDLSAGVASLFLRNLSAGGTQYHPVEGLQGVNAGLGNLAAGSLPADWNTMSLDVLTDVASASDTFAVDNLVPVASATPPPVIFSGGLEATDDKLIYTLENLTPGSVVTPVQDGWKLDQTIGGASSRDVRAMRAGSMKIFGRSSIGAAVYRKNDAGFSYPPVNPGNPLVSYIDVQARTSNAGINAVFHHGADANRNGILHYSETGPGFGLIKNVRNLGLELSFFYRGAGYSSAFVYSPVGDLASDGEWLRLRMTMDFATGLGRLAFLNLSRGQRTFAAVAAMQNLPLELHRLPAGAEPANWNYMHLRFDTLTSGAIGDFGMAMDNLVPNSMSHPFGETSGADPFVIPLVVDDLIPGNTYRLLHRATLGGSNTLHQLFEPTQRCQTLLLTPPADSGFWLLETDD